MTSDWSKASPLPKEPQRSDRAASDQKFESRSGYSLSFRADYWRLSKDKVVPIGAVTEILKPEVADGFRSALAHYAKEYSASHVFNVTIHLLHYLRATGADAFSVVELTNYRSSLTRENEYRLSSLRGFITSWFELGYPGVQPDVIETLKAWRLRGNTKGRAVKRLDPKAGPLDDIELEALNTASAQLFETGKIDAAGLAQVMLLTHLGSRPIQTSHIKIKDLALGEQGGNETAYILNLPQAKQQGEDGPFRGTLKPKRVRKHLWEVLQMQARQVVEWAGKRISPLSSAAVAELPLFPNTDAWPTAAECSSEHALVSRLQNDQLHVPTNFVRDVLKKVVRLGNVRGRDGDLLTISPRRLRYTTGSRAAREGFGKWVIANLLDHKDTQNAGVYTDNHPNFTKVIDKAMSLAMAPLAQAFMGTLVKKKAQARLGDDPRQEISDGFNEIGVCGSHGYCGALAPIACYTCIHFQPLLEAPHGQVLDRLLEERERVKQYTNADDDVVVGATDRTILAVSQVIRLCRERKAKDADSVGSLQEEGHG